MKYYKVRIPNDSDVEQDQIIDGYLGNAFGNGKIAEYTRGEAIKKARMFGGKIEFVREIQYAIVTLTEVNGNFDYTHKQLIERDIKCDMKVEAEDTAASYFGDESTEDKGLYWDEDGERTVCLHNYKVITYDEYKMLSEYL